MKSLKNILYEDFKSAKSQSYETVLTISNSANELNEYLTPIRLSNQYMITGLISTDIENIINTIQLNQSLLSYIFIDIEKKIAPRFSRGEFFSGNHYDIVRERMPHLDFIPFAPNVLTVNAAITKILKWKTFNKSLRVGIVGFGNLGFKIAQQSVEMGCDTFVLPRIISHKEVVLSEAINFAKPSGTIASVGLVDSLEKLFVNTDMLILTSPKANIINENNFKFFKDKYEILDVGKGNVSNEVLSLLPNLSWLDVGEELVHFVVSKLQQKTLENKASDLKSCLPSNVKISGQIALPNEFISNFDGNSFYTFGKLNEKAEYIRLQFNQITKFGV